MGMLTQYPKSSLIFKGYGKFNQPFARVSMRKKNNLVSIESLIRNGKNLKMPRKPDEKKNCDSGNSINNQKHRF